MIIEKLQLEVEIDSKYLCDITMPVPFEDEIDDFINTIGINIDKESLSYNPMNHLLSSVLKEGQKGFLVTFCLIIRKCQKI